ncbi:DUF805 domain-containing protein [Teredinibacter purpureus]|uniref:DUF805 domain-containing protein n=1 Tax=Teredinibacter purpureus TaxID=2731756 RepID=UPI000695DE7B|nr:DUF805 domain-containing protein [Teredinibacter purpureus]
MTESNPYSAPQSEAGIAEEDYQPTIFALNGRIGRLRYLTYAMLYNIIIYFVLGIASALLIPVFASGTSSNSAGLYLLIAAFYFPMIALYTILARRRLHDLDKSGWLLLLFLVPLLNILLGLYMLFASGTHGTNRFGPQPTKNHPALWAGLLLPFIVTGILAAVALPAYQEYVARAQAAQNLPFGD